MHKAYLIGGAIGAGAVLVVLGLLAFAYHHEFSEADACEVSTQYATSPSGHYRAEMQNKRCKWGLGFAANPVHVKVEKLGKGGWFYTINLLYDGFGPDRGLPAPAMNWIAPNSLEIQVHSHNVSGSLTSTNGDLTVKRNYISVPSR